MTTLDQLPRGRPAVIRRVHARGADDAIARRLGELGFVPGESVRVVAHGPLGREPVAVQLGYTRFALRRAEAERIEIDTEAQAS